ncbi:hypothetical protein AVEN_177747-1 [Araneus ventricosus]|uniref:MULE transposase domain-containing protein n=1 Tax=Araneus ventricosus TaxID=182803 RepID=A0A4Y2I8W0_ARAVE|nr:hypothetical protein AVEN_177747-1 [Araneus ventricosus]
MSIEIFETKKNKPSAVYSGYQYRKFRSNIENIITWLCINERSEKCKGILKTKDNCVVSEMTHSCKPNEAKIDVKKQVANIRRRVCETDLSVSKIYQEEIFSLFQRGYEIMTEIPTLSSIKSSLHKTRRRVQGISSEASTAADIVLSSELLKLSDNSTFLLADTNRIIVFVTQKCKDILQKSKKFYSDGTFKSCPKQFLQIYSLHADIGSSLEEVNIIPIVFALLPNKTQATYVKLFTILKEANWSPECLTMDFEVAAIMGAKIVFPALEIKGCNFHFNQCLWRQVQSIGLADAYKCNTEIRLSIRMCAAFLPEEDIDDAWIKIQEDRIFF